MKVLVLNVGSSSVKYDLFEIKGEHEAVAVVRGQKEEVTDFSAALEDLVDEVVCAARLRDRREIAAVGHRVVHGGAALTQPTRVDAGVLARLRETANLAPLHNPPAIDGIEVALGALPDVPHVAVFDTAFHATIPEHARRYAVSAKLYRDHGVRRFGFHGTSHAFVARGAARLLGRRLEELLLVTLHLGNGASAAAIARGRSIDTSMGMTPLEGLVMGTRSGDLDPSVPLVLARAGLDAKAVEHELNKRSGLYGIAGASDMREVLRLAAEGDADAKLAVTMFEYRVKKYIGAYHAILGGLDAVVFTAGIGEHAAEIRAGICRDLGHLGIAVDPHRNAAGEGPRRIDAGGAVAVLVVPTDEEREIARQVAEVVA